LPRTSIGRADLLDAAGLQERSDAVTEDPVIVAEHETRLKIIWHSLSQLVDDPAHGREASDIEMQNLPPTMLENDKDVEDAERRNGDSAEIDGPAFPDMIAKEGQPGLLRLPCAGRIENF